MSEPELEDLLRSLAPQVLGILLRRYGGNFADAEDAVQEALIEATATWPAAGTPREPRAWLITVAQRRLIDHWRSETARRARDERSLAVPEAGVDEDEVLHVVLLRSWPPVGVLSPLGRSEPGDFDILGPGTHERHP